MLSFPRLTLVQYALQSQVMFVPWIMSHSPVSPCLLTSDLTEDDRARRFNFLIMVWATKNVF